MSYPLAEELWTDDPHGTPSRLRYRPILSGFTEYAAAIDDADPDDPDHVPRLRIENGELTIPEDAPLGSFVLELRVVDDDGGTLGERERRVHVHHALTALWVDPPRLTVREGHRVRPRVLAVFDDPDGDGTGEHATPVELTDRALGRDGSYTRRYLQLATDDEDLIELHDPRDEPWDEDEWHAGDAGPRPRSWQLTALDDAGEAELWVEVRPDHAAELRLDPDDDPPLASPAIELVAAPAFDEVPEAHRRLRHVAGQWPARSAADATNILFLTEGFREDEWADEELLNQVRALLGASPSEEIHSLASPSHAPWDALLEEGRLNVFMAHLPSQQDGVTIGYRGAVTDRSGDGSGPYDPPERRPIEDDAHTDLLRCRPQIYQRRPPEPDDEAYEWNLLNLFHVVGHPNRNDRQADYLATIERWHERFASDGSVPPMFDDDDDASEDDQPVPRDHFDMWRRYAEPRFVDGRDTAFGMVVGSISQDNTHDRPRSPDWGYYPDISHVNTYLTGLLAPDDPDVDDDEADTLVARWMQPGAAFDPDADPDDPDADPPAPATIAGPDRHYVYLLLNGVPVRGFHRYRDDISERFMVSGLHRDRPDTAHHVEVVGPPDAGDPDRPDLPFRARLVPRGVTMVEHEQTRCIGTIVHELHHAFGLGDEYEESRASSSQVEWAINLVPPLDDEGADLPPDLGADLLARGLPWDVPRARWAERIEGAEDGDGETLRVFLPGGFEDRELPEELHGDLRIRRALARRTDPDALDPPEVLAVQLEVLDIEDEEDEDGAQRREVVLGAVDGQVPTAETIEEEDHVLFAPVHPADAEDEPGAGAPLLRLLSPPARAHLADGAIMNPDHDCGGSNERVTQPSDLGFDAGRSPSRLVGIYRGGGRTRCGAYRPTGISRMRTSDFLQENLDLHHGDAELQALAVPVELRDIMDDAGMLDEDEEEPDRIARFRAIVERELAFPPSIVEAYTLGDVIDPFVLGEVDARYARELPDEAPDGDGGDDG